MPFLAIRPVGLSEDDIVRVVMGVMVSRKCFDVSRMRLRGEWNMKIIRRRTTMRTRSRMCIYGRLLVA
jgi:hypothetical protein